MSLSRAAHLAHNLVAQSVEDRDTKTEALATILKELARGLEEETRDIKRSLQNLEYQVRNLR